jgi:hypothetical protein
LVLDWLANKSKTARTVTVAELVARKQYDKAIELLQAQMQKAGGDSRVRLQLADTLILAGRGGDAVGLLRGLADELAQEGFAAKSIAILKRIQKIEPRSDVEDKLATMIEQKSRHSGPATGTFALRRNQDLPELGMEEIAYEPSARFEAAPEPAVAASTGFEAPARATPVPTPALAADFDDDLAGLEGLVGEPATGGVVSTPLFPDFAKDELVAVMRGLELLNFAAGDIVVAEGEPGDSLFLLTTGRVKAFVKDPAGRYEKVRELFEGDFFGEISILTGSPRTATVTCATACELLQLDRRTLDTITASHPRVLDVLQRFYDQRANSTAEARIRSGAAVAQ